MNVESQPRSEAAVSSSLSAGAVLRQYRQTRGVEPETLAASLHVPVSKIQALEEDRLDAMPDIMFARALAMSVCRYLKVDATPVLARMPQQDASRVAARNERGIDSPLSRPSLMPDGGAQILQRLLDVKVLAAAVVVLGLLYLSIQGDQPSQPVAPLPAVESAPPAEAGTASPPASVGDTPAQAAPAGAAAVPGAGTPTSPPTITTPVTPAATSK